MAPREDRWHQKPTAVYGGVGFFPVFLVAFALLGLHTRFDWALVACAGAMFSVGLYDDAREMTPQVKSLCQLVVALAAVSKGISLDKSIIPWAWLLVGVTNAVNILGNIDGLSSGVFCVAGLVLTLGAATEGLLSTGLMAAMLAGAAGGSLIYNFNPAKILMGDCGLLFLGFILAATIILSANRVLPQAFHLAMALLVPLGDLVVPIFDTTLVSFQRTSHGRSIVQGGRDHSSHRLVFLGLSERRSALTLLFISLIGGLGSLMLLLLVTPLIAAVIIVGLVSLGIYLGEVKIYDG